MKIILPTCNEYLFLIENLIFNFSKYWPDHFDVLVLGYDEPKFPMPKNWEFISLGIQNGPQDWSNDLIQFFNNFTDEYFINFIDDTLLTKKVNHDKILELIDLIKLNNNIGKIFLHGSLTTPSHISMGCKYEEYDSDLVKITNDSNYRTSIQSSIWRTSFFKQCLKPNMNPWDFELQTEKYTDIDIFSLKNNYPMMISHLFRRGFVFQNDWANGVFDDSKLDQEDIDKFNSIFNNQ